MCKFIHTPPCLQCLISSLHVLSDHHLEPSVLLDPLASCSLRSKYNECSQGLVNDYGHKHTQNLSFSMRPEQRVAPTNPNSQSF